MQSCNKRASHGGLARQAHDEQAAAKWLKVGLVALGLHPADLGGIPNGAPEMLVLGTWLRQRTKLRLGLAPPRVLSAACFKANRFPSMAQL